VVAYDGRRRVRVGERHAPRMASGVRTAAGAVRRPEVGLGCGDPLPVWPVLGLRRGVPVTTPLYQAKAEFFQTLGTRRGSGILELLTEREHAVSELLPEVGIEPAHLSQQLAVLRRMSLVHVAPGRCDVRTPLVRPQVG